MKITDLGQALGIFANLGVIAGIIFLGYELRQNNQLLGLEYVATQQERQASLIDSILENSELLELLGRDERDLTPIERDTLVLMGFRALIGMEARYQEFVTGFRTEESVSRTLREIYHRPRLNHGTPLAWPTFKRRADPSFVQWFENNVINPGPP